jgi:four helix bundle protein
MPIRNYRDLIVWQKSMDLVESVYIATRKFPKEELYGLTSQLRRAVVSIPSNIAEGQGRRTDKEFAQFLAVARGSLHESETQILIAERLGYLERKSADELMTLCAEVNRLLHGLLNAVAK